MSHAVEYRSTAVEGARGSLFLPAHVDQESSCPFEKYDYRLQFTLHSQTVFCSLDRTAEQRWVKVTLEQFLIQTISVYVYHNGPQAIIIVSFQCQRPWRAIWSCCGFCIYVLAFPFVFSTNAPVLELQFVQHFSVKVKMWNEVVRAETTGQW